MKDASEFFRRRLRDLRISSLIARVDRCAIEAIMEIDVVSVSVGVILAMSPKGPI
jgi:hypothetical protein